VRPSPPLLRHAAHCYNYSDAVEHAGTGRRHACYCTPYGSLSTAPSSPSGDAPVNHHASTLEVAPVQAQGTPRHHDWSKIRQDNRQLHGTVHHTITRSEIARHACKSPYPWPINLLSHLGCSRPSTGTPVQAIRCLEHTPAGRTAPAGTRINQGVLSCLAPTIERQISALITS
jgi:hypothetical protein